jgi:hypothetical protein
MLVPTNSLLVVSYTCDKPRFTDRGHCKDYRHPNGCSLPQATSATRRQDLARSCPGQRGGPEPASLDAITSLPSHSPRAPCFGLPLALAGIDPFLLTRPDPLPGPAASHVEERKRSCRR